MSDLDPWYDGRGDDRERHEGRDRPPRRHDGPYEADRGFGHAPRIGPTGMVSSGGAGDMGTSGRYYEDYQGRADYGGFEGGAPGYGAGAGRRESVRQYGGRGRPGGYDRERERRLVEQEGFGAGAAYREYGRATSGYGAGGGYTPTPGEGVPREGRSWGDEPGDHRGRGPKGYKRSDARIHEDVNDRLTDDPTVDASGVTVTVADGEVTLDGTVTSRFAKRRAEDCADSVAGVRHVQNNLRVDTTPRPGTEASMTDPRLAAISEGRDAADAAKDVAEDHRDNDGLRIGPR
jgi:hypothetical protein